MAMHMGMGFSKIILLLGAGYTGTIMLKNGQLSDILGELQLLVKGMEKSGDSADSESDIVAQVRRLAMEVRQVASARQITVLNGGSSDGGNMSSLVMPAAAAGALGYGYMWWKGLSFSDLMYVTKRSMSAAVSNMTKHLEQVSEALAATKKHLTQRLHNLDEKLDGQKEMSKEIKEEVTNVRADLSQIGYDLDSLQKLVSGLDGKMGALGDKQDFANVGVWYLCNLVGAKEGKMPPFLKALPKPNNPRGYIGYSGTPNMKGLKQISDVLKSGDIDSSVTISVQNDFNTPSSQPRSLSRISSFKS